MKFIISYYVINLKNDIIKNMADGKIIKPSGGSPLGQIIAFFIILFVLWVITGGPERNPQSRYNQFMEPIGGVAGGNGKTYHEDFWGKPNSITNTLPFLK
jgi:hypothetical protein